MANPRVWCPAPRPQALRASVAGGSAPGTSIGCLRQIVTATNVTTLVAKGFVRRGRLRQLPDETGMLPEFRWRRRGEIVTAARKNLHLASIFSEILFENRSSPSS